VGCVLMIRRWRCVVKDLEGFKDLVQLCKGILKVGQCGLLTYRRMR